MIAKAVLPGLIGGDWVFNTWGNEGDGKKHEEAETALCRPNLAGPGSNSR